MEENIHLPAPFPDPGATGPKANIDDTDGPLYILTHPKEFTKEQWVPAMLSCLTGEHGPEAKQMVLDLAETTGTRIPPHLLQ